MKISKKQRYPAELIEYAILLHRNYRLTFRDVSYVMAMRGIDISHKTIFEWVKKYSEEVRNMRIKNTNDYSINVSQVSCNGERLFMYRAINSKNKTLDIFFQKRKNENRAKKIFSKMEI